MRKKRSLRTALIVLACLCVGLLLPIVRAQKPLEATQVVRTGETETAFIKRLVPKAQELSKAYGVKTSILLAQASLGSGYGTYYLADHYHNLLQLGAENSRAITLASPTYDGKSSKQTKSYQIYHTDVESLEDYLDRLKSGEWGKTLYTTVATADSYKTVAQALQSSSFSEDPDYASKLIAIIESENLTQYD